MIFLAFLPRLRRRRRPPAWALLRLWDRSNTAWAGDRPARSQERSRSTSAPGHGGERRQRWDRRSSAVPALQTVLVDRIQAFAGGEVLRPDGAFRRLFAVPRPLRCERPLSHLRHVEAGRVSFRNFGGRRIGGSNLFLLRSRSGVSSSSPEGSAGSRPGSLLINNRPRG